ncbi:GNAT family N-acetyltransferase [Acutalibacter muris]|uniref:GNAT family N-acetyltransferase n=1 Tax=Acutalibacter muris TaxID=1796620 RepID=UPI001C3EB4F0|nr:GNAT family N-acetyltransferase [Acutalibacter muris]
METVISIRNYQDMDWDSVSSIHDRARRLELELAGLKEAFLPLRIAAEREGLFDYPGLYVAEENGTVIGFAACTEDELAWLYVAPEKMRRGVGRSLSQYAMKMHPGIRYIEALKGNVPALKLYESLGFRLKGIEEGKMPGNESFTVQVYSLERTV